MRRCIDRILWLLGFYLFWFLSIASAKTCSLQVLNLAPLSLWLFSKSKINNFLKLLGVGILIDTLAINLTGSSYSCSFYVYPLWAVGQWIFFLFLTEKFNLLSLPTTLLFGLGAVGGYVAVSFAIKAEALITDHIYVLSVAWGLNLVILKIMVDRFKIS